MKSKTSFFSRTIFFNTLKRFWPLFASYIVIWTFIVPLSLDSMLKWNSYNGALDAAYHLLNVGLIGGVFLSAGFSILFAMASFYYLYNNRSVSMMCSLPVKREGLFLSVFSPGLAVMLVSNLIIALSAIGVTTVHGINIAPYAFQFFAMVSFMCIFFYGFAAFCANLTGHILVLPAIYAILNLLAVGLVVFIYQLLGKFVFGLVLDLRGDNPFFFLSPLFYIPGITAVRIRELGESSIYYYNGWGYLGIIAAVGVLFALFAIMLLKRRRMEAAGDVVAQKPLKPVFKYCLSLGCALISGVGLHYLFFPYNSYRTIGIGGMAGIVGFMLIGAFIGYFAGEMLNNKTLRVFGAQKWKGIGILALLLIAICFAFELDVLGYEHRVPSPEKIEAVVIGGAVNPVEIIDFEGIETITALHESIVNNKARHENVSLDNYYHYQYMWLEYRMEDGSFMNRSYFLNPIVTEDLKALEDFLNLPEVILARHNPGVPVSVHSISDAYISFFNTETMYYEDAPLTGVDAFELYTECILPDLKDGTLGLVWLDGTKDDIYEDFFMACSIYLRFDERLDNGTYNYGSIQVTPTINSARTNAWLIERGIDLNTQNVHSYGGWSSYY